MAHLGLQEVFLLIHLILDLFLHLFDEGGMRHLHELSNPPVRCKLDYVLARCLAQNWERVTVSELHDDIIWHFLAFFNVGQVLVLFENFYQHLASDRPFLPEGREAVVDGEPAVVLAAHALGAVAVVIEHFVHIHRGLESEHRSLSLGIGFTSLALLYFN